MNRNPVTYICKQLVTYNLCICGQRGVIACNKNNIQIYEYVNEKAQKIYEQIFVNSNTIFYQVVQQSLMVKIIQSLNYSKSSAIRSKRAGSGQAD
jgi:hypothetical protein